MSRSRRSQRSGVPRSLTDAVHRTERRMYPAAEPVVGVCLLESVGQPSCGVQSGLLHDHLVVPVPAPVEEVREPPGQPGEVAWPGLLAGSGTPATLNMPTGSTP